MSSQGNTSPTPPTVGATVIFYFPGCPGFVARGEYTGTVLEVREVNGLSELLVDAPQLRFPRWINQNYVVSYVWPQEQPAFQAGDLVAVSLPSGFTCGKVQYTAICEDYAQVFYHDGYQWQSKWLPFAQITRWDVYLAQKAEATQEAAS